MCKLLIFHSLDSFEPKFPLLIPNSLFHIKLIAASNLELELKKKSRRFGN
ncbi:hypothetical protein AVDCRST_MAG84-773 [uncultured Microcoleus sp.]|uniref:Uncharacterized protein n=1 Tax=uncultured Microcoleus sp. TaxID=259945 RepID=A0A6J4KQR9_9CYAN|nr:hypothetical protein AVDCRST_MAG84-773 [uncultured Microcoleus sp.]